MAASTDAQNSAKITRSTLSEKELTARLGSDLFIRPLLDPEKQVNPIGIDFRLGYDFLVSIQGREGFINTSLNGDTGNSNLRNIFQFFQPTRRQLGETFILHPHQTVLATSLEYIKMPNDLWLKLVMRSSYSRLGITISTIVQPGYCGCISLELTNNNRNSINLTVGARVFQGLFFPVDESSYFEKPGGRKYVCQVRPEPSLAISDSDLQLLNGLWKEDNGR